MNWKDIKGLIREELNEETNVTADNTTFIMRTGVNKNPTKLGLKIQFTPKEGALDPDTKARLKKAFDYAKERKEASKRKTQTMNKSKKS